MDLPDAETLRAWDRDDTLAAHRAAFALPEGVIYLDGNSLGPLPHATTSALQALLAQQWGTRLIRAWDEGWMAAPARIGDAIATLIGAQPGEVVAGDSTTVLLYKALAAAAALRPDRAEILTEAGSFPTDRHVAQGLADRLGLRLLAVPAAELPAALGPRTAVLLLCEVQYRTGARHDMAALTAAARAQGALTVWDLSHSAGAFPVALHQAGADFAVGCGYKFLNGGPGAPGFLFVAARHQAAAQNPIQGWIGHAAPFAFDDAYQPAPGIARFLSGTPAILGLTALETGVACVAAAGMPSLWAKSQNLFNLFAGLAARDCPELICVTPASPAARGSQIAFRHPQARDIMAALVARGVIGDFRPPDVLRFGLTPLYTSFSEVAQAVDVLRETVRLVCA